MSEESIAGNAPSCIEAERAVLGGVLLDPSLLSTLVGSLGETDFLDGFCRRVFLGFQSIEKSGEKVDPIVLSSHLQVPTEEVIKLEEEVPHSGGFEGHLKILKEKRILRELRWKLMGKLSDISKVNGNFEEFVTSLPSEVEGVISGVASSRCVDLREGASRVLGSWLFTGVGGDGGLSSGLRELDGMIGGFRGGEFILVAGRPSMGKSALLLWLMNVWGFDGVPVGLFSMEMGAESLMHRLMSIRSGVDLMRVRRGFYDEGLFRELGGSLEEMKMGKIWIEDRGGLSIGEFRGIAGGMVRKHGLRVIGVDYLQLMKGSRSRRNEESRVLEVGEISGELKRFARDYGVVVIGLSQLNRAADMREDKRPRLSDLRESGSLEQDADIVILMYRPEYYKAASGKPASSWEMGLCELEVAKQRNGPVGVAKVGFTKESGRFYNLS